MSQKLGSIKTINEVNNTKFVSENVTYNYDLKTDLKNKTKIKYQNFTIFAEAIQTNSLILWREISNGLLHSSIDNHKPKINDLLIQLVLPSETSDVDSKWMIIKNSRKIITRNDWDTKFTKEISLLEELKIELKKFEEGIATFDITGVEDSKKYIMYQLLNGATKQITKTENYEVFSDKTKTISINYETQDPNFIKITGYQSKDGFYDSPANILFLPLFEIKNNKNITIIPFFRNLDTYISHPQGYCFDRSPSTTLTHNAISISNFSKSIKTYINVSFGYLTYTNGTKLDVSKKITKVNPQKDYYLIDTSSVKYDEYQNLNLTTVIYLLWEYDKKPFDDVGETNLEISYFSVEGSDTYPETVLNVFVNNVFKEIDRTNLLINDFIKFIPYETGTGIPTKYTLKEDKKNLYDFENVFIIQEDKTFNENDKFFIQINDELQNFSDEYILFATFGSVIKINKNTFLCNVSATGFKIDNLYFSKVRYKTTSYETLNLANLSKITFVFNQNLRDMNPPPKPKPVYHTLITLNPNGIILPTWEEKKPEEKPEEPKKPITNKIPGPGSIIHTVNEISYQNEAVNDLVENYKTKYPADYAKAVEINDFSKITNVKASVNGYSTYGQASDLLMPLNSKGVNKQPINKDIWNVNSSVQSTNLKNVDYLQSELIYNNPKNKMVMTQSYTFEETNKKDVTDMFIEYSFPTSSTLLSEDELITSGISKLFETSQPAGHIFTKELGEHRLIFTKTSSPETKDSISFSVSLELDSSIFDQGKTVDVFLGFSATSNSNEYLLSKLPKYIKAHLYYFSDMVSVVVSSYGEPVELYPRNGSSGCSCVYRAKAASKYKIIIRNGVEEKTYVGSDRYQSLEEYLAEHTKYITKAEWLAQNKTTT